MNLHSIENEEINRNLSERIRKIRVEYGLSQADLADRMGCSSSTYGRMERNACKASFQTLLRIASAIGVSMMFMINIDCQYFREK